MEKQLQQLLANSTKLIENAPPDADVTAIQREAAKLSETLEKLKQRVASKEQILKAAQISTIWMETNGPTGSAQSDTSAQTVAITNPATEITEEDLILLAQDPTTVSCNKSHKNQ